VAWRISQVQPDLDDREVAAVAETVRSGWLTEGPHAEEFLAAIRAQTGARHAVLAPNGTLGLFLALLALDLPPDSEILIPTFTFFASASAAVFAGLRPVFIDADPGTFNLDVEVLDTLVTDRTRAVMPVGVYGQLPPMDRIMEFARRHDLVVVEDAAQCYGVSYRGRHGGTWGQVGVISFFADKTVTTGEGGVVLTDDDEIYRRLRLLRNQGRENSGSFVHDSLGMNFRVTDMQCAVGREQLRKLPQILARKQHNHRRYVDKLGAVEGVRLQHIQDGSTHVPFRFAMTTDRRAETAAALEAAGIQTRGFFFPLHRQLPLRKFAQGSFPVADQLTDTGLCLPVHAGITDGDIDEIADIVRLVHQSS
jgi:perosamine synthetase